MEHAIKQATCTNCDDPTEESVEIVNRNATISDDPDADPTVTYTTGCAECNYEGIIMVTEDGMSVSGEISFEDASWNEDEEDDSDD